jgi:hypothetical protein
MRHGVYVSPDNFKVGARIQCPFKRGYTPPSTAENVGHLHGRPSATAGRLDTASR